MPPDQAALQLVDIAKVPPPVPVFTPPQRFRAKPHGGSAAKNIKSEATAVVAPEPVIKLPVVDKTPVTTLPRLGVDPTQGAAKVAGPAMGSGGTGDGSGIGNGTGAGVGEGNDVVEPPHLATPVLRGHDFPREILGQWPRAATVFLRLRVDARGYVAECMLDRGTNVPEVDSAMCNAAHDRLRFRPALNGSGQAVAGWFGYAQPAPR